MILAVGIAASPWLLLVGGLIVGVATTAIVIGALAAASGLAYAGNALAEGHTPWEDPEAWFLGQIKAEMAGATEGPYGIFKSAHEATIPEQLHGGDTVAAEGGSASPFLGATGRGPMLDIARSIGEAPPTEQGTQGYTGDIQHMKGVRNLPGVGGAGHWDMADDQMEPDRPTIGDFRKQVGIQEGIAAASVAGSLLGAGAAAGAAAPAAAPASAAPAAMGAAAGIPAVTGVAVPATTAAPVAANVGSAAASAVAPVAAAAPQSAISAFTNSLRVIPNTIGPTATGILQKAAGGAITGGISSWAQGGDPGRGALIGGISGGVSGGISAGAQAGIGALQPSPVAFGAGVDRGIYAGMGSPNPAFAYGGTAQPPSFAGMSMRPVSGFAGNLGGSAVSQLMAPKPPQPVEPVRSVYTAGRPPWYEAYDAMNPNRQWG